MKTYYCPTCAMDCPYFDPETSECKMPEMENCSPEGECDEYDYYNEDYEDDVDETGFNPYMGCYDYDC